MFVFVCICVLCYDINVLLFISYEKKMFEIHRVTWLFYLKAFISQRDYFWPILLKWKVSKTYPVYIHFFLFIYPHSFYTQLMWLITLKKSFSLQLTQIFQVQKTLFLFHHHQYVRIFHIIPFNVYWSEFLSLQLPCLNSLKHLASFISYLSFVFCFLLPQVHF